MAELSRVDIPQKHRAVPNAPGEQLPIRTESHVIEMPGEGVSKLPSVDIPQTDAAPTTIGEQLPIRRKTHERASSDMLGEGVSKLPSLDIPQTDGVAPTKTGEQLPIRTESHGIEMPGEGVLKFPGIDIPQTDGVVPTTTAGEQLPIRRKTHESDRPVMPGERVYGFSGVNIPQTNSFVNPTSEHLSIRRETHAPDLVPGPVLRLLLRNTVQTLSSIESVSELSSVDIPEVDGPVPPTRERLLIQRKIHAPEIVVRMPGEGVSELSSVDIP